MHMVLWHIVLICYCVTQVYLYMPFCTWYKFVLVSAICCSMVIFAWKEVWDYFYVYTKCSALMTFECRSQLTRVFALVLCDKDRHTTYHDTEFNIVTWNLILWHDIWNSCIFGVVTWRMIPLSDMIGSVCIPELVRSHLYSFVLMTMTDHHNTVTISLFCVYGYSVYSYVTAFMTIIKYVIVADNTVWCDICSYCESLWHSTLKVAALYSVHLTSLSLSIRSFMFAC